MRQNIDAIVFGCMRWVSCKRRFELDLSTFIYGDRCLSILTLCNSFILVNNLPYCHKSTPNLSAQFLTLERKKTEIVIGLRQTCVYVMNVETPKVYKNHLAVEWKQKIYRRELSELKCAKRWVFCRN